jgi:hypothetical protein
MSRVKYDIRKVPRELLEEYIMKETTVIDQGLDCVPSDVHLRIRKAAEVPLRTKAEIDADIARAVRDYVKEYSDFDGIRIPLMEMKFKGCFGDHLDRTLPQVLIALLSEETSD